MAFDTSDEPYVTTIFIEATVDPVGRGNRTEDLTREMKEYLSSNYDVHIITMRIVLLVCLDRIKHLHP